MAWTYTKARAAESASDGGYSATWDNAWTLREVAPTQAGYLRLRLDIETYSFWSSSDSYVWYSADSIACAGETRSIRPRSRVPGEASYSSYLQLPAAWSGQIVTLRIAWKTVSVRLEAAGVTPSAVAAEGGHFGHPIPITLTPALDGVRHTVTVICAGHTETLLSQSPATALSWLPDPETYLPLMPGTGRATATIRCESFSGGVSAGMRAAEIPVTLLPGEAAPVLSPGWAEAVLRNEGAAAGFSVWIQGHSRARVLFDASKIAPRYGASLAGYAIRCEGLTVDEAPYDTGVLPGTRAEILCTVTDSRGQTASETLTLTLEPYAPPRLSETAIFRSDAAGEPSESGGRLAVKATAAVSPLGGTNTAVLQAWVRPLSGSFPQTGESFSGGAPQVLSGLYSPDIGYEGKITLTDGLGQTAAVTQLLPSRRWAMKFRADGNGAAFGKAAETDAALELGPGWALVLHDTAGHSLSLDYAALSHLLSL